MDTKFMKELKLGRIERRFQEVESEYQEAKNKFLCALEVMNALKHHTDPMTPEEEQETKKKIRTLRENVKQKWFVLNMLIAEADELNKD